MNRILLLALLLSIVGCASSRGPEYAQAHRECMTDAGKIPTTFEKNLSYVPVIGLLTILNVPEMNRHYEACMKVRGLEPL